MNPISFSVDQDGIALITIDCADLPVNVYTPAFTAGMTQAVERVLADDAIVGAVISSAKDSFLAGADLKAVRTRLDAALAAGLSAVRGFVAENRFMRHMETGGKPFAAAINGTALGGGLELCLACHYRVLSDAADARVGLPEVGVGLMPAGGGTQRLPRLLGIETALPLLLEGSAMTPARALALGIVDEIAPRAELVTRARRWLLANRDARQPWDRDGYRIPGCAGALAGHASRSFYAGMAQVRSRTQGNYPAPLAILSAVYEGTQLPFERGMAIEAQYFAQLAANPVARNLVRTQFVNRKRYERLAHRPQGIPQASVQRLGILGAGMMGAGIAHAAALAGIEVVLIDTTRERAAAGRRRAMEIATGASAPITESEAAHRVGKLIRATERYGDLDGCGFVIEAVYEDRALKADVIARAVAVLSPTAILASNTSTLPITSLAADTGKPERFIGMHFFSPVERMPLLEIILGERTSRETLAHAMDLAARLKKTPIVVNDSPGFYTSRIFCAYVDEAMAMLAEGVKPALIENGARMAGMATSPLAVLDEVSLDLQQRVVRQAEADAVPEPLRRIHALPVIARMNAIGRLGRKRGGGFYDYPEGGEKRLWPGLAAEYPPARQQPDVEKVKRRLLYIQALESVRCLEADVIAAPEDADIGALLGLGFPAWTGGPLSLVDTVGVRAFVLACDTLADAHGSRFRPTQALRERAWRGESFYRTEAA
ncbi:fatty acid oxidation complex subunit alpha (plasmid) [Cupriavidus necator N-1]|uniref:Fatty acid oxidation complex subunit alpha n=1 Tax=Cupriavidus necator (strain ATCC 43291 / DSM 13513 / CCUG 52238 / LMG 8453 / N-1) TaxID=1042878 RepID=F8GU71_CUPNN|nr:3-hydroxyacyl-CoA dehydrogenase NAD-binding domain-containing protein [Cupriavidus necator]AEI82275.1 fatty acid oxidation complex subunit alpha [Cupriavidus necator N-1]MDX6007295.1 3-hydroxyacyl-CoA dehydrogenase NAD-binding domain-containing protein [Cupriavidus necator]